MSKVFSVACPRCGASVGSRCRSPNGDERASHAARVHAYLATLKDVEKPGDGSPDEEEDSTKFGGNAHQTVNTW
jgi:hypothetical protein